MKPMTYGHLMVQMHQAYQIMEGMGLSSKEIKDVVISVENQKIVMIVGNTEITIDCPNDTRH